MSTSVKKMLLLTSLLIVCLATLTPASFLSGHHTVHVTFKGLDKIVHFSIYCFLGINLQMVFEHHKKLVEIFLFAALFSLTTEVIQLFIPGRHMDIFDGFANLAGLAVGGYWMANKFSKRLNFK